MGEGVQNPVKKNRMLYPRVVRGGSFKDNPDRLRSAARGHSTRAWKQRDPKFLKVCGGTQMQPILVFVLFGHGPNPQKRST